MNIKNEGILNPTPADPGGYTTKNLEWVAVPYGKRFIIIHDGQQVHTSNNYKTAVSYIKKQIKMNKKGPLDKFTTSKNNKDNN